MVSKWIVGRMATGVWRGEGPAAGSCEHTGSGVTQLVYLAANQQHSPVPPTLSGASRTAAPGNALRGTPCSCKTIKYYMHSDTLSA
jgi:hypothetical protein